MDDLISRQAMIEVVRKMQTYKLSVGEEMILVDKAEVQAELMMMPSADPTLYGYNIEHLEMIARVLQKENLPPERIAEVVINIGKIVAIVKDELKEILRKAAEQ